MEGIKDVYGPTMLFPNSVPSYERSGLNSNNANGKAYIDAARAQGSKAFNKKKKARKQAKASRRKGRR